MDKLNKILIALTILGLFVSIYMTVFKLTNDSNMCVGSHACVTVNESKWSEVPIAGVKVPVAVIGIGGYLSILLVLLFENRNEFLRKNATMVLFALTLMGFLFSMYLVYVEVALIKALCPFCVTSQATMTIIFILTITRLVRQPIE